jgi:hypothetical protein
VRSAGRGLEEVDALGGETAPCRCAFIGPRSKAAQLAILRRQAADFAAKPRWRNQPVTVINKLDSGINTRTPDGYLRLPSDLGFEMQTRILDDLLRIPHDHFIMIARNT